MKVCMISIFPENIQAGLAGGVVGQAIIHKKIDITYIDPRDFSTDKHRSVDDKPFGGGDGMVMMPEVLAKAIQSAKEKLPQAKVIYMSPQGKTLTQGKAMELSVQKELIILCGRYAGVDQRTINEYVDEEISIGDYVLSGGELASMVLMDVVGRLIPGVLGNAESPVNDSFMNNILEGPLFTRPQEFNGQKVPKALLSGDHDRIRRFNLVSGLINTFIKRPDLIKDKKISKILSDEDLKDVLTSLDPS